MLEKIFIIAFIVLAIHGSLMDGMIFGSIRKLFSKFPEWFKSPAYDCCFCMTAWYGSAAYWIIYGNSCSEWAIVVLAAMGVNFVVSILLSLTD